MITLLRYISGCAKPNYKEVPDGLIVTINSDWSCTGQFQTLKSCFMIFSVTYILLIKITAARNEAALSYHKVRGLYVLAVGFAATMVLIYLQSVLQNSSGKRFSCQGRQMKWQACKNS